MSTPLLITLILAALALGGLIAWLLTARAHSAREHMLNTQITRLEAELEGARREQEITERERNQAREELQNAFKAIGSDVLRNNSEEFLRSAKQAFQNLMTESKGDLEKRQDAIKSLVDPIRESLKGVDSKITELEKNREGAYKGLVEQVKAMQEANENLRRETGSLARAMGRTTTQGQWGELQLRRVVEIAGMLEHVDFDEQMSTGDGERPDMIIHLAGDKQIVVDAKAPMEAFYQAMNTEDESLRENHLRDHAANVRSRAIALGRKRYWEKLPVSPEYVVMFLPSDAFFSFALMKEPSLFENALQENVIITTPSTLLALLKAVAVGWRQERVEKNAKAIADLGRELHDRVGTFATHFSKIGSGLSTAVKAYDSAVGSLESRVLPAARKFEEFGAGSGKHLDEMDAIDGPSRSLSAPELTGESDDK
jgi:DNA recombination protein RmuC